MSYADHDTHIPDIRGWEKSLPQDLLGDPARQQRRKDHLQFYFGRARTKHTFGKNYELDYDIVNYLRFIGESQFPDHIFTTPPMSHMSSQRQRSS